MKTRLLTSLVVPALLLATTAFADDKAACLDAASKGQQLRNAHKLVEAHQQLLVCAAGNCPKVVQTDCTTWLADVEKALPTVVLSAKNGVGADLVDVKVSVDGQPLVSQLDGQAIPMNAGPHTFHFERSNGLTVDQQVVVKEGEKNQSVAVVIAPAAPAAPPPKPAEKPADSGSGGSPPPWKTVGWVLGGVGVVGLGVGTVFGIIAISDKSSANCDSNGVCDPGTVSGIKSAALISDVGWIAGGVLLAGGAALVLFAPSGNRESTTTGVRLAPMLTASGGGAIVGGSW